MGIYLDDGVNIDASWVNHIAVSRDGINWDTINKHQIDLKQRFINKNDATSNRHPFVNKPSHGLITIARSEDQVLLVFDPNDVENQPTWAGGTPLELRKAVADITGWLN